MNKALLLTSASAFALMLGVSAPAYAADGARAEAEGTVEGNTAVDNETVRVNTLENVFNPATGIVHSQQNNGSNNALDAATAVHADVTGGTSLTTGASASSTSEHNDADHLGDHDPDRENIVVHTMNGFVGSATLQQNNGDNNAINSATALDGVDGDTDGVEQYATASSNTHGNGGVEYEDLGLDEGSFRINRIITSFNGAYGVFTVQQNNGNGNAMSSATAVLGVTGDAGGIDQDASANSVAGNFFDGSGAIGFENERSNAIANSFNNDFAGVATVQQNNGDNNAMAAATAVAGTIGGNAGMLTQHATANPFGNGTVSNKSVDHWSRRFNSVHIEGDGIFKGAHGVATVQQNNGDNNAMAAANAVAAHVGEAGDIHQGTGFAMVFSGAAGNAAADIGSERRNDISHESFNEASGAFTVQQNNGDANAIGAATAVAGITGDSGNIEQHARNGMFITGSLFNGGEHAPGGIIDKSLVRANVIEDAMNDMSGVVTVQQNNGNANNIGATTGLIGVGGTSGNVLQAITAGTGYSGSGFNKTEAVDDDRDNLIDPAFDHHEGIATVQQNNGDANNMVALTTVTMTGGAGTVGQDLSANNISLENNVDADDSERLNKVEDSFNNLKGIVTVQQNNGDANSIVAATGLVFVNGATGDTDQSISAWGESNGNIFDDNNGERNNLIDPAFVHAEGIITVQQNNGSGNAMTALTGGVANQGGDDLDTSQDINAGGSVDGNSTEDFNAQDEPNRNNTITDLSFHALTGIATVQQNNGDGNVMSASTGVIANFGEGLMDDITKQDVTTDGSVNASSAIDFNDAEDGVRRNKLNGSVFNWSNGVVTVQQNNGSNNAISAATGVRVEIGSTTNADQDLEDVSTQLAKTTGSVTDSEALSLNDDELGFTDRRNRLTDAFKGGVNGVFTVQQNNGDNNAIGSAVALAANINGDEDIDSALDNLARTEGTVAGNNGGVFGAESDDTKRLNTLDGGAFDDAAGIVTVQQNNGSNNVIGSATGVVANVDTGQQKHHEVTASAEGTALVDDNSAKSGTVDRLNLIDDTMNEVQGIVTVQQNNGDNNVIGSAVSVTASTEMPGFGPAASSTALNATVSGNASTVNGTLSEAWSNTQTGAFIGASGIMVVQQNNGNNNDMGSAISAVANGVSFGFNP